MHPRGPDRKLVAAVDIDRLAEQVRTLASSQNLLIVPATPVSVAGFWQLVLLGSDDLSAAEFCELAASSGARLLYVQAYSFDAGTDPDLGLWERTQNDQGSADDRLAGLNCDAQVFNGRICQLELAFAVGCILHCWAIAADWHSELVDRAAGLVSGLDQPS